MVGPLESLPSRSQLHPVPSPRIHRPSPPSTASRVPARGFTVDSRCRQRSIALNHIPPLHISHELEYSLASWKHLALVHPRLEARGQPLPPSPGFHAHANLRVLRPLTRGPQGQPSALRTPHGCPCVQGSFLTSYGRAPLGWPVVHLSIATGLAIPRCCCLALFVPQFFTALICSQPIGFHDV